MKKLIVLALAFVCAIIAAGCNRRGVSPSGTVTAEYTGIVTDRFTEGGGNDWADCLRVNTDDGVIIFTITDGTQIVNAEDISVNDSVQIVCEEYSDSSYRPIVTVTILNKE